MEEFVVQTVKYSFEYCFVSFKCCHYHGFDFVAKQFEEKFSSNIDGVDLVLGAQGSPMQLILSSVYHIDNPTGNISYDSAKVWMKHPFVEKAIPLAFGDNYRGFKIVGTNKDYLEKYKAKMARETICSKF